MAVNIKSQEQRDAIIAGCKEDLANLDRIDENIHKSKMSNKAYWLNEHEIQRLTRLLALDSLSGGGVIPEGLNKYTADLVLGFASALAQKLLKSEQKYGWSDGWMSDEWRVKCLEDFHKHITKGDPVDVAAYCAFMWFHGWSSERDSADSGYKEAFYRIAEVMGITAQPLSPKEVFDKDIMPRLKDKFK